MNKYDEYRYQVPGKCWIQETGMESRITCIIHISYRQRSIYNVFIKLIVNFTGTLDNQIVAQEEQMVV